ncbi:MFS general substrate transporter [Hesseltinella vesiculosa]|uniref:MFS general substrate transporter n=1 Tax=Hesseltinella vesiculosa TaxID=101127 RepID=A0A1X2GLN4_9FUNG|nr:MFS general substrate transporter [Hesseltinella vesiculosa]
MQAKYEDIFSDQANVQLNLSFAGTLLEVFVNLMGPVAQFILARYGLRVLLLLGSFLAVLGLEMAGFTTQIWHLYLCQGVIFGSGASLVYAAVMTILPSWFDKHRSLAMGCAGSGSGLGAIVLTFVLNALNGSLGPSWAYRILGFIVLGLCVVANLLVRERVKVQRRARKLNEIFSFSILKDTTFLLWMVGSVTSLSGFFLPFWFIPSYAQYIGLSADQGTACVSVMSAGQFVGRIFIGFVADRIGRLNTDILVTLVCGLSSFLIWTFAHSYGVLMLFCFVFGFTCSSYFTLMSPITYDIVGHDKFPTAVSTMLLSNIISVFGPSIASGIQTAVGSEPYLVYKMFTGTAYILGGLILIVVKFRISRQIRYRC